MYHIIRIKPSNLTFFNHEQETILDAARKQGFQFPHDCESGVCGTCRGKLLDGQIAYDYPDLPGLSDEERDQGFALFCSARPTSDLTIHIENVIAPWQLPIKKLDYSVVSYKALSPNIYQIILNPPENDHFDYLPGQYIEIVQENKSCSFSIANTPNPSNQIELHIRHTSNNLYLFEAIKQTEKLCLQGPFGSTVLRREPNYPYIFLASGTGFAPAKAIIEALLAESVKQPIYLYWGVREKNDWYCEELVKNWAQFVPNFHYIPVLSGENSDWTGKRGWVFDAVLQDHPSFSNTHVYAFGPADMATASFEALKNRGLSLSLFYSDAV